MPGEQEAAAFLLRKTLEELEKSGPLFRYPLAAPPGKLVARPRRPYLD
jgi:hypothetical protein